MKIIISNSSDSPIYEQIYDAIKQAILTGEVQEGESLPSIRGLAKDLQVSVITTKRAYEELEKDGFIDSVQGKGSFVAFQNPEMVREKNLSLIEDKISDAILDAKKFGLTYKEFVQIVKILYED